VYDDNEFDMVSHYKEVIEADNTICVMNAMRYNSNPAYSQYGPQKSDCNICGNAKHAIDGCLFKEPNANTLSKDKLANLTNSHLTYILGEAREKGCYKFQTEEEHLKMYKEICEKRDIKVADGTFNPLAWKEDLRKMKEMREAKSNRGIYADNYKPSTPSSTSN
jgi:hypothetical protein